MSTTTSADTMDASTPDGSAVLCSTDGCANPRAEWRGHGPRPKHCDEHYEGKGRVVVPARHCLNPACDKLLPEDMRADAKYCPGGKCASAVSWDRGTRTRQADAVIEHVMGALQHIDMMLANGTFAKEHPDVDPAEYAESRRRVHLDRLAELPARKIAAKADVFDRMAALYVGMSDANFGTGRAARIDGLYALATMLRDAVGVTT